MSVECNELVAQKLEEAMALIEKGWCQGNYSRLSGGAHFCAYGAICEVSAPEADLIDGMEAALLAAMGESLAIERWNDAPGRTQAEVIEAFRKAAELARGSEPGSGE